MLTFNDIKNTFITNRNTIKGRVCIISDRVEYEITGVQTLQNITYVLTVDSTWLIIKEGDTVTIQPK